MFMFGNCLGLGEDSICDEIESGVWAREFSNSKTIIFNKTLNYFVLTDSYILIFCKDFDSFDLFNGSNSLWISLGKILFVEAIDAAWRTVLTSFSGYDISNSFYMKIIFFNPRDTQTATKRYIIYFEKINSY